MTNRMMWSRRALRVTAASVLIAVFQLPQASAQGIGGAPRADACAGDAGGISVPRGFCATIFADNVGHARHIVVAPNHVVYVNTWSGPYYSDKVPPFGGFLVALKDTNKDGRADITMRFGETISSGGHGGTGIGIYKDGLFAEINDRIVRYDLKADEIAPTGKPQTVVSGLPITGDHPMHPFVIDATGRLFVDLGSATNTCEMQNRMPGSPGHMPCKELETRGGVWLYDANKTDQVFSPSERFATGLRNAEGLAFDASGRLYATQHGRDQLFENWPQLYSAQQGQNLPGEVLVEVRSGADYGWPECYFDNQQQKLVLAPEYGGDGGKKVGPCAEKHPVVAAFPAHWAPNDLKIYNGAQFPAAYRGGAFIAFHGSWNRAPGPQGGYNVVFQPLSDGKASGPYVVFADGFAGTVKEPGRAAYRPSGLAVGPDGSLYVTDDVRGRIWRITFTGEEKVTEVEAALSPAEAQKPSSSPLAEPPEGIHPEAGQEVAALPAPPGVSKEEIALGGRIFRGEVGGATCGGCHGSDGRGTPVGSDLTSGKWLWGDGSLDAIRATITNGVPKPKEHLGAMPPKGGVDLSDSEVAAVATYVWAIGHQSGR